MIIKIYLIIITIKLISIINISIITIIDNLMHYHNINLISKIIRRTKYLYKIVEHR